MEGKRVLVTGAAGFIGSHLVERLVALGADVRALVHYDAQGSIGNLRFLPPETITRARIVPGDLLDAEFLARQVADCEIVFHLGALVAIPHSYLAARSYLEANVVGTFNLVEAVRAAGHPRLVHTSTSEVYGSARYIPIDEAHPLRAQSPYAATKIAADKLVEAYHASFGIDCITVRPFNTYGPRQSARAVIPTVIGQVLGGGDVIRLGATAPIRDMSFVADTVAGLIHAAAARDLVGSTWNLGVGQGHSIARIAALILEIMGSTARIEMDAQRVRPAGSEVDRLIAANGAFRAATGWRPEVPLEDGLRRTVEFFRRFPDLLPRWGYVV